jgi:hypothetical protein
VALDIDVGVVGDVEHDLDDPAAGEVEAVRVGGADPVATVVADAQALAAQREVPEHRPDLVAGPQLVVDVQLQRSDRLVVLTHPFLGELDPHDVPPRGRDGRRDHLLGWDTEEVVDVAELAVLDDQGVAAEARAVGEDHPLGVGRELDLGQHLVGDAVHVGRRPFRDLGGARVVGVLAAGGHGHPEFHADEGRQVLGVADDVHVVQREDVVRPGLLQPQRPLTAGPRPRRRLAQRD